MTQQAMNRDQLLLNEVMAQRENAQNVAANLGADLMMTRAALDEAKKRIAELEAQLAQPPA